MPVDEGFRGTTGGPSLNIPVPDPSLLTTQQLREAISNLQMLLVTRLDAMDEAAKLRRKDLDHVPYETSLLIDAAIRVVEQKFVGISQQFTERDVRTEQASSSADDALKAALQAAKELVGAQGEASAAAAVKSETSFTKQIDQIGALIQTGNAASDARITELKERIDRGEGTATGAHETRNTNRLDSSLTVSIIAAVIAFFSIAAVVIVGILK